MLPLLQINYALFNGKWANPDLSKPTQEIALSKKNKKIFHPSLRFNNNIVSQTPYQKYLGIFLDARLTFE